MAAPPARARADYDYLIKLLLIGDSGSSSLLRIPSDTIDKILNLLNLFIFNYSVEINLVIAKDRCVCIRLANLITCSRSLF